MYVCTFTRKDDMKKKNSCKKRKIEGVYTFTKISNFKLGIDNREEKEELFRKLEKIAFY